MCKTYIDCSQLTRQKSKTKRLKLRLQNSERLLEFSADLHFLQNITDVQAFGVES
jgi:hypothetical protein